MQDSEHCQPVEIKIADQALVEDVANFEDDENPFDDVMDVVAKVDSEVQREQLSQTLETESLIKTDENLLVAKLDQEDQSEQFSETMETEPLFEAIENLNSECVPNLENEPVKTEPKKKPKKKTSETLNKTSRLDIDNIVLEYQDHFKKMQCFTCPEQPTFASLTGLTRHMWRQHKTNILCCNRLEKLFSL